ncbi:MAG TPA: HAD-IB family phosphatase [Gemmatimonadaceae bacterium]|nr:HAD-IB family phosphatase [Gemmatimonadaceae bacterium]
MPAFASVIFDCDSTLSSIEGIEELSRAYRDEIVHMTEAAMRGEIPLESVYGRRLELVRPTRDAVDALGTRYVESLVPGARETVAGLLAAGVDVRILSGGLRPPVLAVARALGIEDGSVDAVDIFFDARGEYAGFDDASPLTRSAGKADVIRGWGSTLPRPAMLVGDGATDLAAAREVELFVAFAGVIDRPTVTAAADFVVRERSLAPILPLALEIPSGHV